MKPKPSSGLSRNAKKLWLQIADELDQVDGSAQLLLDMLAQAWDRREASRAELAKSGAVFLDRFKQQKVSPHATIERDCTLAIIRLHHALGLDLAPEAGA
jgi:phage terminase small subunit